MAAGYAVLALDDQRWTPALDGVSDSALTAALGAVETAVDAFRIDAGAELPLPAALERLVIPIGAAAPVGLDSTAIPPGGLAIVPAGVDVTVAAEASVTLVIVGAPADPVPDAAPIAVDLDDAAFVVPETSDVATAFLTGPLGAAGLKVNARRLEPDQAVPTHTEGEQEELFVPVRGPASMRIAGEPHSTPPGVVVRVAPDVPRSAINDGEAPTRWVMIGAPPTGGPTDWAPDAEIC